MYGLPNCDNVYVMYRYKCTYTHEQGAGSLTGVGEKPIFKEISRKTQAIQS